MTQITLTLDESEQAQALVRYLESLDFVKVEHVCSEQFIEQKAKKATEKMRSFLETLPSRSADPSEVTQAIKEIRLGDFS
jgi:histidyl-tRNA synthetase